MGLKTYSRVFGVVRQYVKGLGIAIVGWMRPMYRAEKSNEAQSKTSCVYFT
jgi:hypothetical protein